MGPRMVFRKGMRASSARASDVQAEVDKVEKPTQSSDPEAYPFGVGRASVRNIPIALLIEDNVALDYLLSFARKEFSSEPVELLAAHREMNRERTRTSFAPDPLHVRSMLAELLEAHVAENAPMQVTLPGTAVSVLRTWLGEYSALAPKEKAAFSLPMAAVESAIAQCLSDLKNDLVPRFSNSPLGEELSRLHVGAMLSHSVGYDVLGSCELSSLERDALEFWCAADGFAKAVDGERGAKGRSVYEAHAPKLPLLEVPVEEVERIEAALKGSTPPRDLFLVAQTIAANVLTEHYHRVAAGDSGGEMLLRVLGVAPGERQFDRAKMPAKPALATNDSYADLW